MNFTSAAAHFNNASIAVGAHDPERERHELYQGLKMLAQALASLEREVAEIKRDVARVKTSVRS